MSQATYPIRGIPLRDGNRDLPVRREVNRWVDDPDSKKQLDLFLLALKKMQETPHEELLSYFRIAGIHSYPLQDWDGVKYRDNPWPNNNVGFCTHNLQTFSTWHRPYILLFEQRLHELMKDIIKNWDLLEEEAWPWHEAADTFRLPYWDWAQHQPYIKDFGVPEICTYDTVTVMLPGGKTDSFANPLAKFSNPLGVPMGDKLMGKYAIQNNPKKGVLPWSRCIATSRYGVYTDLLEIEPKWIHGINDWKKVNQVIKKPFWYAKNPGTFADAVERMLSPNYHSTFEDFGCTVWNKPENPQNTSYLSIEYIHNVAHISAGGNKAYHGKKEGELEGPTGLGHMSDVPVSAFDPIFWLHHCNIDRLLAIWQTFNEEKWFTSKSKDPSEQDPLLPFHNSTTGDFWNSRNVRQWTDLRYQYDELAPIESDFDTDGSVNKERYIRRLRLYFNILYRGSSDAVKAAPSFMSGAQKFPDYIVNILYDRYALDGRPYSIMLFLGEPPVDEELHGYNEHVNYLGQVYTFSSAIEVDGEAACGNCEAQRAEGVLSRAQVPVTIQLMQKASMHTEWYNDGQQGPSPLGIPDQILGPLPPEMVERLFAEQLRVVYVELGGEVHGPERFHRTEIALLHAPATVAEEEFTFDGETTTSIVPTYDGQYEVLFKKFGGPPDQAPSLFGAEAASTGNIMSDSARTSMSG